MHFTKCVMTLYLASQCNLSTISFLSFSSNNRYCIQLSTRCFVLPLLPSHFIPVKHLKTKYHALQKRSKTITALLGPRKCQPPGASEANQQGYSLQPTLPPFNHRDPFTLQQSGRLIKQFYNFEQVCDVWRAVHYVTCV